MHTNKYGFADIPKKDGMRKRDCKHLSRHQAYCKGCKKRLPKTKRERKYCDDCRKLRIINQRKERMDVK